MAINSKAKGAAGEREIAGILRDVYGYTEAKRGQQYCGLAGNADVVDALPGIHMEVKRVEKLHFYDAMEQAKRDAMPGEMPAVFHRKNRSGWLVTMELDDFMRIYREWESSCVITMDYKEIAFPLYLLV